VGVSILDYHIQRARIRRLPLQIQCLPSRDLIRLCDDVGSARGGLRRFGHEHAKRSSRGQGLAYNTRPFTVEDSVIDGADVRRNCAGIAQRAQRLIDSAQVKAAKCSVTQKILIINAAAHFRIGPHLRPTIVCFLRLLTFGRQFC